MNVLIADDFQPNRRLLRRLFEADGFTILEAASGDAAWELLQREKVDAVVSDILMPGKDGFQLCAEVRQDARLAELPFIFFTGIYDSEGDEELAMAAGADRFIRKPSPMSALLDAVRNLISSPGPHRQVNPAALDRLESPPEYTDQLVAKLEEKNDALDRRTRELRTASEKLAYAQGFYRAQLDHFPTPVWNAGRDGKVVHCNRKWLEFTGRTLEQELGTGWVTSIHPDDAPRVLQGYLDAFQTRKSFRAEYRLRRHDGEYRSMVDHGSPIYDQAGHFDGYIGACHDITERQRTEEALRRREAQFEEAHELSSLGTWDWDLERDFIGWSTALYHTHGLKPEAYNPTYGAFIERIHPDDREHVARSVKKSLTTGQPISEEFRIARPDGTIRIMHARGRVICDASGKAVRMFGVMQDITERKHVEQELGQTKVRLEVLSRQLLETSEAELRRIARELHDEIGQSLTATKLEIEAARRLHDPAAIGLRLDDGLALIEHLLRSVRELSLNLRPASLDALGLAGAIHAHASAVTGRVGLELNFEADELKTRLEPSTEIACFRVAQEAVTNVLRHAHATSIRIALRRSEGDFLRLEVEDNGFGFDPEAAMSSSESGVSFGLLGMRERAELTGGSFSCLATPGQGTEIIAFFPMRTASS